MAPLSRDTVDMFRFAAIVLSLAVFVLVCGCKSPSDATPDSPSTASSTPSAGGGGDIAPMGGLGAGPMTPVSGSESLQGGGSAAGSVLKERAKGVAAQPPSSLNQAGGDEGP